MRSELVLRIGFLISFLAFLTGAHHAHPGYGMFIDSNGDIIFTDLLHDDGCVRKLTTLGKLITLIDHQHVHWILPARDGSIWGTNHEYLPATKRNRNTLWKLTTGGEKNVVIPPTENPMEFSGVNFVVLESGEVVYNYKGQIYIRQPEGNPRLVAEYKFERIISLQRDEADRIYIADNRSRGGSIFRMTKNGEMELIADRLLDPDPPNPPFPEKRFNMLYAMFISPDESIFVANCGSRRVTRIDQSGEISHIHHSEPPWYPVAYSDNGQSSYVMEMGFVSGQGNIGPRILEITHDVPTILIDVENSIRRGTVGSVSCTQSQLLFLQLAAGLGLAILLVAAITSFGQQQQNDY